MELRTLLYEKRDRLATITLNRPQKANALSTELWHELERLLDRIEGDEGVRVVVIKGAGKGFSAGNDMSERCEGSQAWRQRLTHITQTTLKLWNLSKPTIAMVHGYCLAAACELAVVCDFVIAAEGAQFGEPEILHGSFAQLLMPWFVGLRKAKEIILTGENLSADEAYRLGLINKVVTPENLEEEVYKLAHKLSLIPPYAVSMNKRGINKAVEIMGILDAADYNNELSTIVHLLMFEVADAEGRGLQELKYQKGVKAFLESRRSIYGSAKE